MSRIRLATLATLILATLAVPASLLAQSQSAFDHANPNAAFLRCGTEHPTALEARLIEAQFEAL